MAAPSREEAAALDRADPLGPFVDRFVVTDPDLCYLDGNSLGRLPKATMARLRAVVEDEWGSGLVRSWDRWIDRPFEVGDAIGALIGAAPGQVAVVDSTTQNLYALVDAACGARPERRAIVIAADEFPTDRYVVAGIAAARRLEVREATDPAAVCAGDVAVVVASAVDYRSAAVLDIDAVVSAAHSAGALVCVDLSHAAGVLPLELDRAGVDLAVGCTYKYLCGGPGSPAFLYVRSDLQPSLRRPVWGWFAQRDQFAMGDTFEPHPGLRGFLAGTPPVVGLAAVEEGVRLVGEAGVSAIHAKARALGDLLVALTDEHLGPLGFSLASPREAARRGAHVTLAHPDARRIGSALRVHGVVPDVRPPDRIRFGLAPLSTRFVEVWDAVDRASRVVSQGAHLEAGPGDARVT